MYKYFIKPNFVFVKLNKFRNFRVAGEEDNYKLSYKTGSYSGNGGCFHNYDKILFIMFKL